jgi:hypothetical protein
MEVVVFKISDKTPGAILQPHPPPCESEVNRGSIVLMCFLENVLANSPT